MFFKYSFKVLNQSLDFIYELPSILDFIFCEIKIHNNLIYRKSRMIVLLVQEHFLKETGFILKLFSLLIN